MRKLFIFLLLCCSLKVSAQSTDKNFKAEIVPKQPMSIDELNSIVGSASSQADIIINTPKSNENFKASRSIVLTNGGRLTGESTLQIGESNASLDISDDAFLSNITYYDGLGRTTQNIAIAQSPQGKDIVNHYEYDQFGRVEKSYLPLPSNQSTGNFVSNPVSQIMSYYQTTYGDTNPYAQQGFDDSPLGRVLESAQPGNDWKLLATSDNDHTSKFEYNVNKEEEVYRLDIGNNLLLSVDFYGRGELVKNTFKNENWSSSDGKLNTKSIFKDKSGRKIAEFSYLKDNNGSVKKNAIYYVYENNGNLTHKLTPKLIDKINPISIEPDRDYFTINDMLQNGSSNGGVNLEIYDGRINMFIENEGFSNLPEKRLKSQTIIPSRIPNLPNMYVGEIQGLNVNTREVEKIGEISFSDDNIVVTRTLNVYVHEIYLDISVALNSISQDELNNLAYQYKYDKYNRQIGQKMPGKAWQYVVYDQLDRPILTQDYNLRSLNQWMFTKYDVFGRTVYSGKFGSYLTRAQLQQQVDNSINNSNNKSNVENRSSTIKNIGGVSINYTNNAFPKTGIIEITAVNYYDDYNFSDPDKPSIPTSVLGQIVTTKTKGLPTASWSKTIGGNTWTKSYPFHDHKTQEIKVYGKNHLSGSNIVETELDFTGKVKRVITDHKRKATSANIRTTDRFEYDHVGRLINQYQQVNNQPEERILGYVYNELGELTNKKVGGKSNNTEGLQNIEYTRNIRGWLKQLNNPNQNLGKDLFAFEAKYNNTNSGASPLYNGAITGVHWKSSINNSLKTYNYQYDHLGRLSNATFSSDRTNENNRFNVSNLSYDENGNITSLSRNGWQNSSSYVNMDNLAYEYKGNQLTKVIDSGNNQYGFKDVNTTNVDFEYDQNGNLVRDNHKKMSISYNYLNLPGKITFDNGDVIDITYNSTGAKLSKTYKTGSNTIKTEYLGGFQYTDSRLQFFGQAEGFVYKAGDDYKYAYVYTDHLGNNRLSYTDANNNNTIESNEIISEADYYPFGLTHSGEFQTSVATDFNYKFQGKELQKEGGLDHYDFGSRMYDPSLGRWFAVDPQGQFSSPYLAMGNNPVMMVDPDGEFSFLAILVGAFVYTAYDAAQGNIKNWGDFFESLGQGAAQSAFAGYDSPANAAFGAAYSQFNSTATGNSKEDGFTVSFNPTYNGGSNFGGWGLNASINARYGNLEAGFGYGFTSYGTFDVDKGHRTVPYETRTSFSLGWNDGKTGLRLYTTKFDDNLGGQRVGGLDFTSGKFGFRYENDGFPFQYIGLGDGNDSYRTAALQISWDDFSYGFNLFTGYRDNYDGTESILSDEEKVQFYELAPNRAPIGQYGEKYPNGFVIEEGPKYRLGAEYLSYKGYRVGLNSEHARHVIQNLVAHDINLLLDTRQPGFVMTNNNWGGYFQYNSYSNPYTLW